MVLTRFLIRTATSALLLLALSACLTPRPPARLDTETPLGVVFVVDQLDAREVTGVPPAVHDRVLAEARARNFAPRALGGPAFDEAFARRRLTAHRVSWLAGALTGDDPAHVLLVELRPEADAAIVGRFRWTIDARVTTFDRSAPADKAISESFTQPAFVDFAHQQADAALTAGAPAIAQRVGRALDDWMGGL